MTSFLRWVEGHRYPWEPPDLRRNTDEQRYLWFLELDPGQLTEIYPAFSEHAKTLDGRETWYHLPIDRRRVYYVYPELAHEYTRRDLRMPCELCFAEGKECLLKRVSVSEETCYCEPLRQ